MGDTPAPAFRFASAVIIFRPTNNLTPLPSGDTAQAEGTGREAEDPLGVIYFRPRTSGRLTQPSTGSSEATFPPVVTVTASQHP